MGLIMKSKISKHFKRSEFACKCGCGQDTVDYELLIIMEEIHQNFDIIYGKCYIFISSGNRCEKHNDTIDNSSPTSGHIYGKGADIKVYYYASRKKKYVPTIDVHEYLCKKYPDEFGFIMHKYFNHIDVKNRKYHVILENN